MNELKIKQDISNQFIVYALIGIIFIGFVIRFLYFPYDISFSLDASVYFSYAYEMAISGEFPNKFILANNGWPTFLAVFFSMLKTGEFQTFVDLQRIVSIVISVLTVFPMYFLCRKFFPKIVSLIGGALFILEPRVISNSILGITEPVFNLLIITSLVAFFSKKNWIYFSFAFLALATIVRYEAFLLIIPFSIMFFLKLRRDNRIIFKYLLCLGIFILILYPMMMIRTETMGVDGITSHVSAAMGAVDRHAIQGIPHDQPGATDFPGERNQFRLHNFLSVAFSHMFSSLGVIQLPIFVLFFPIGVFFLLRKYVIKKISYEHITLILFIIVSSMPILYSHGRDIVDLRYYLILYPVIILICCFGIEKIRHKIRSSILLISIFSFVIVATFAYLEYDKTNYELERESFEITSKALKMADKINAGSLHGGYITVVSMIEKWPELDRPNEAKERKISPYSQCKYIDDVVQCTDSSDSLEDFIKNGKEKGLDHIVIDEVERDPRFIQDVFVNEEKYPYLEKMFDSKKEGYTYYVKIFKINFKEFEKLINE